MTSQQGSTPYSLRLPFKLSQLIDQFAKKIGKPAPDTVRAGIEAAFSNEYRMLALEAANTDRPDTLRILRGAVDGTNSTSSLPLPVYSGLMYFLHWAYLHSGSAGYANPRYVSAMLDVIGDLIDLGERMSFTDGHPYARRCLGINDEEGIHAGIHRIKMEIQNGLELGYAEMLTRPLEAMADDLQYLDTPSVARIFAPHLKTLLPVALLGAKAGLDVGIVLRDMNGLLPEAFSFDIGPMIWGLHGESIALVVSEGHHSYVFGVHAVLSIFTAIECSALDELLAKSCMAGIRTFTRGDFEIARSGDQVVMHTNGGYRLVLTVAEAVLLIDQLKIAFSNPAWRALARRCCELMGDI